MPSSRAGRYVAQPTGYKAFIPAPLPPAPSIKLSVRLFERLAKASAALGRLDGSASRLPNPDLFVGSFVQKEALLSSQIEGTQASLEDILAPTAPPEAVNEVAEVVNYVRALRFALARLQTLPPSLRLIREIHAELMTGVRGGDKTPGEFRHSQNWIGPQGAGLGEASFVPPPPHEMAVSLGDWERYMVAPHDAPELVKCALLHVQFETIHPFLDGNGRVGRLLITFLLQHWGLLKQPLLYLSLWFKEKRQEYYARLQAVRDDGAWEEWLEFFLDGVAQTADAAAATAAAILDLRERDLVRVRDASNSANAAALLDHMFRSPMVAPNGVVAALGVTHPTATSLLRRLTAAGVLVEVTGRRWGRVFRYEAYMNLLSAGT